MITDALIMLVDGSWGPLAGAVVFRVPEAMAEEFSVMDEKEIIEAINDETLDVVAAFTKE